MARRKRKYQRHEQPTPYRVLEPPLRVAGTSRRSVGSPGRVTEKMLAYNACRLLGVAPVEAARRAGYLEPYAAVERNQAHPGLIEFNRALLARYGLTVDTVAASIRDAMDATKPVSLLVGADDPARAGEKVLVECEDNGARLRACALLADLLGMRATRAASVQHVQKSRAHVGDTPVTCDLKGEKLHAAYFERLNRMSEDSKQSGRGIVIRDPISGAKIEVQPGTVEWQSMRDSAQNASNYHSARIMAEIAEIGLPAWCRLQTERRKAKRRRQGASANASGVGMLPTPV